MSKSLTLTVSRLMMALALIVAIASLTTAAWMTRGAQQVQRVEPADAGSASLFGDAGTGTLIGSTQLMIVRDPAAFLPGSSEGGARLVNEQYLREHGIYPLQVKSVWFVRNLILLASAVLFTLEGVAWLTARRSKVRQARRGIRF
ncbi:hypothetical protein GCM10008955_30310 [Deinococcus malanensis]|uniref:Uncharacterized protein n=1 Tax=Deinococcus malanensis TaxID=1706855 RepID=A0ABQ2F0B3_9DEIO|nr:hypothetical protein [Deinococcus malanensis]GGK34182.1 hypothetical protein GCM10008955_30310 [Deinococcus malanensis]